MQLIAPLLPHYLCVPAATQPPSPGYGAQPRPGLGPYFKFEHFDVSLEPETSAVDTPETGDSVGQGVIEDNMVDSVIVEEDGPRVEDTTDIAF